AGMIVVRSVRVVTTGDLAATMIAGLVARVAMIAGRVVRAVSTVAHAGTTVVRAGMIVVRSVRVVTTGDLAATMIAGLVARVAMTVVLVVRAV
ncbi:hypothetical protein, partial [Nonomuraea sp. NPDC059022]|uniref:hypothetical protein n=1 Tax=Nonomuraea sp. NPDC059022 TaxID=3346705 RepID=UPI003686A958